MCVRAPAPLDADQVKTYQNCLADGGAVAIDFAEPAHLEASRMALLLGGFALEANGTQLVATKLAPPTPAARRRRRAPPPVARATATTTTWWTRTRPRGGRARAAGRRRGGGEVRPAEALRELHVRPQGATRGRRRRRPAAAAGGRVELRQLRQGRRLPLRVLPAPRQAGLQGEYRRFQARARPDGRPRRLLSPLFPPSTIVIVS